MAHYKNLKPDVPTLASGTVEEYQAFEEVFSNNHEKMPGPADIVHFLSWSEKDAHAIFRYNTRLELQADQFFPHFIANGLPTGLTGLVIAAMFAAAMSSLDSGVNSITAVVSTDFIERFRKKELTLKLPPFGSNFIEC